MNNLCELCERPEELTKHHLIPRSEWHKNRHRKKYTRQEMAQLAAYVCRPCHEQIHMLFTNFQLANEFEIIEKLRQHPEIQKWLTFIKTKQTGFQPQMTPTK